MQWKEPEVIVVDILHHNGTDIKAFSGRSVGDPVKLAEQYISHSIETGHPSAAFKVFILDVDKGCYMPHGFTTNVRKVVNVEILMDGE